MGAYLAWRVLLSGPMPAVAAGKGLDIELSGSPIGDGKTDVTLTVTVRPRRLFKRIKTLELNTPAGTIVGVTRTAEGYQARFTPPALATVQRITISAEARAGRRLLRGRRTFVVHPPPEPPSEIATEGPLDLRVTPSRLVLGRDVSATVTLRGTLDAPPMLRTNVGSLSHFESAGDGRLRATYTAAAHFVPQVAVIAARSDSGDVDWTALPLWGSGTFETKVGSFELVRVRVRDQTLGPFRANRAGVVAMPIVAVPGARTAEAVVVDRPDQVREFDLGVPPFNRLLAVCPADTSSLLVFVVNAVGEPQAKAPLVLTASVGTLGDPAMVAPGLYEAAFTVPHGTKLGTKATLEVGLQDAPESRGRCVSEVQGGPPKHVAVVTEPASYAAGSGSPVTVFVDVRDEAGHAARVTTVALSTHTGQVSDARSLGGGRYTATWTLSDSFDGRRRAFLKATVRSGKHALSADASVALQPGKVVDIQLEPEQASLRADGWSDLVVRARPVDAHGNLAHGVEVTGHARGRLSPFTDPDEDGVLEARYSTLALHEPARDTLSVRVAEGDTESALQIDLAPSKPLLAGAAKIGYQSNLGNLRSPLVVVEVGMRLPMLEERLQISVASGFSSRAVERGVADIEDQVDISLWAVPALVHVTYRHPVGARVEAYAGATGGCYAVGSRVQSAHGGTMHNVTWTPAFGGLLGADASVWAGRLGVEIHYVHVGYKNLDLSGNVGGLMGVIGYRFEM